MLIFICSIPRSGGTLLYQLTKEITEQAGLCAGRGFAKESITNGVIKTEFCKPWMIERMNNGALAFGSYRDFRDVILSLRNFYNRRERIKGVSKRWTIQDVLDHRPKILESFYCWENYWEFFIQYEGHNSTTSLAEGIVNVVSWTLYERGSIDAEPTPQQKQTIINKYTLDQNIKRIATQKPPMDAGRGSMLTKWHISPTKGKSIWRDVLNKKEVAAIERVGGEWLKEYGYR